MVSILGILCVFVMVFGGYMLAGGKLDIILKSLPYEIMMIGGAAIGAFLISNTMEVVKTTLKDLAKVFKGPKWKPSDYQDLICLLYELILLSKKNPIALEAEIDDVDNSSVFSRYPRIQRDASSVELIGDTFRSALQNYDDPNQIEEILEKRLNEILHHKMHPSHALQTLADGLPALGIVAAVLGVIKTMGSIDQPPEVLGKLIGGALVGTFLGVFLAYCLVAPFAGKTKALAEEDIHFYRLIRDVLIANFQDHSATISVEVGRQAIPPANRPSFAKVDESLKELKRANT